MKSGQIYYPFAGYEQTEGGFLIMDQSMMSGKELDLLYGEAEEYDFLKDKSPQVVPNYWDQEN